MSLSDPMLAALDNSGSGDGAAGGGSETGGGGSVVGGSPSTTMGEEDGSRPQRTHSPDGRGSASVSPAASGSGSGSGSYVDLAAPSTSVSMCEEDSLSGSALLLSNSMDQGGAGVGINSVLGKSGFAGISDSMDARVAVQAMDPDDRLLAFLESSRTLGHSPARLSDDAKFGELFETEQRGLLVRDITVALARYLPPPADAGAAEAQKELMKAVAQRMASMGVQELFQVARSKRQMLEMLPLSEDESRERVESEDCRHRAAVERLLGLLGIERPGQARGRHGSLSPADTSFDQAAVTEEEINELNNVSAWRLELMLEKEDELLSELAANGAKNWSFASAASR